MKRFLPLIVLAVLAGIYVGYKHYLARPAVRVGRHGRGAHGHGRFAHRRPRQEDAASRKAITCTAGQVADRARARRSRLPSARSRRRSSSRRRPRSTSSRRARAPKRSPQAKARAAQATPRSRRPATAVAPRKSPPPRRASRRRKPRSTRPQLDADRAHRLLASRAIAKSEADASRHRAQSTARAERDAQQKVPRASCAPARASRRSSKPRRARRGRCGREARRWPVRASRICAAAQAQVDAREGARRAARRDDRRARDPRTERRAGRVARSAARRHPRAERAGGDAARGRPAVRADLRARDRDRAHQGRRQGADHGRLVRLAHVQGQGRASSTSAASTRRAIYRPPTSAPIRCSRCGSGSLEGKDELRAGMAAFIQVPK